jgi:CRISPR-associated protein Cas5t
MTLTKLGLPRVEIALGAIVFPVVQSIYQQLHNYPVGAMGRERAQETKGTKYNIQPAQREFLCGLDAYLSIRGNESLEAQVRQGLHGGARSLMDGHPRYGIPFLGDNNFMIDFLREESPPQPAYWYRRLTHETDAVRERCRLTAWIDRADMTRTVAYLYAPTEDAVSAIPQDAWTPVEPPSRIIPPRKREKKRK